MDTQIRTLPFRSNVNLSVRKIAVFQAGSLKSGLMDSVVVGREAMLKISIIKVDDPGCLWGKILEGSGAQDESDQDYKDLQVKMNLFYHGLNLDVEKMKPAKLEDGQVCVVFCPTLRSWCRGVVETILGTQVTCLLLDHGERIIVKTENVKSPLDEFLQLPFRLQRFKLARIHPMRLEVFIHEETAELVPSAHWDSSATKYLYKLLQASTLAEAFPCGTHAECTAIKLYLTIKNVKICVNEDLVVKKFACSLSETAITGKQRGTVDRSPVSLPWDIFSSPYQVLRISGCCSVKRDPPQFLTRTIKKQDHLSCAAQLGVFSSEQNPDKYLSQSQLPAMKPMDPTETLSNVENEELHNGKDPVCDEDKFFIMREKNKHKTCNLGQKENTESILVEQLSQKLNLFRIMKFLNPFAHSSVISKFDENAEQMQETGDSCAEQQSDFMWFPHPDHDSDVHIGMEEHSDSIKLNNCDLSRTPSEQRDGKDQLSSARLQQLLNPQPLNPDLDHLDDNKYECYVIDPLLYGFLRCLHKVMDYEPSRKGVLVQSPFTINPCTSLTLAPITEQFHKFLMRHNYSGPGLTESYCWPPVVQGCDTLLVSHTGDDPLTYLPPLLAQLQLGSVFTSPTTHTGPIAVILCPSWEKVLSVLELLEESQGAGNLHPAALLIGLGKDEAKNTKIQNNCQLLITTPFSLVRLLEVHCFLFLRLCHLVLDEAHELYSRAPEQMAAILQHFKKVVSREERAMCPRQIVAVSNHWTGELEGLVQEHMVNPCIIITAKEEAALYGGVQQIILLSLDCNKTSVLLNSLDFSPSVPQKTLIITNTAEEVEHVYKAVSNTGMFALKLHEGLTSQLELVVDQWKKDIGTGTQVILVTTNNCMKALGIMDATCVVHYGFPASRKTFGNRLFCMYENFQNVTHKVPSEGSSMLVRSVLLLSECNARHVSGILRYLKRAGAPLPPGLPQFAQGVQQAKEDQRTDREICSHLKTLGYCRDSTVCPDRHTIHWSVDFPRHSDSGNIQVLPLYIKSASVYYGRIVDQKKESFEKLAAEMNAHYAKERLCAKDIVEGKLYAVQGDDVYHRVRLLKVPDEGDKVFRSVTAYYVDEGHIQEVKSHQLLQLPLEFQILPAQAVEIIVCRVQPIDGEMEFNQKVTRAISLKIKGKVHQAKVVLCLGSTIWVDPMVCKTRVPDLKIYINEYNVQSEILATGLATTNPQHLELLKALCQGDDASAEPEPSESNSEAESLEQQEQFSEKALAISVKSSVSPQHMTSKPSESPEKIKDPKNVTVPNGDLRNACLEASVTDDQQMVKYLPQNCTDLISVNSDEDDANIRKESAKKVEPQSFHPQIKWFQDAASVCLTVKLINPTKQKCEFFCDRVHYSAYVDNRYYCAILDLHGDIIVEQCSSKIKCNEPVIKLAKKERGEWKSLLRYKSAFVSYDFDHLEDENSVSSSAGRFLAIPNEEGCYVTSDSETESD